MPLNLDDLAAACRCNDAELDAGGSVPTLMLNLGVDPTGAVYVAEQRALRVALLASGVSPELLASKAAFVVTPHMLHKRQRDLIPIYAGVWTDGLATGIRAYHDALV